MVPSGIIPWSRHICNTCPKCGTQRQDAGREEDNHDLGSETSFSEVVDIRKLLGGDDSEEDERNWDERGDGKVRGPNELHVTVNATGVAG